VSAPGNVAAGLLRGVRAGDLGSADEHAAHLDRLSVHDLSAGLPQDADRTAFWLNLYNASTQRLLRADPAGFGNAWRFFRQPAARVAGHALSLDAIEHGMLRRSRWKAGFGYLGNPVPSGLERALRVGCRDPRIHFALNCGAASCPPIAAYEASRLDQQLDLATRGYLSTEVRLDPAMGVAIIPRVFLWFIGDFGGPSGIRAFLDHHGALSTSQRWRLRYARYDWTVAPGAWRPPADANDDRQE
jgi:hypothetical protein